MLATKNRVSLAVLALIVIILDAVTADKIKVDLYYESQCPGCRDAITRSFKEAYAASGFLKMAEITLVPFGNAQEVGTRSPYEYECQHGETECQYNIIESCALDKIKCSYQQFQFINCIENSDENRDPDQVDYDTVFRACSALANISEEAAEKIQDCYKGLEGNALEHEMALKTAALSPAHEYVPWIVVDGVHDDGVQEIVTESLLAYVCNAYTGPHKSLECPEEEFVVKLDDSTVANKGVCFRDVIVAKDQ